MIIYLLYEHTNFQDVHINHIMQRPDFGMYYIEEKSFDNDFEAGKYVGAIPNKDIVFTDKAEAYRALILANKEKCENLLKDYF